jgi:hypothetical protein
MAAAQVAGQRGDAGAERLVQQEVLAERLAGVEAVARDRLAQRRQRGCSAPHLDLGAAAQLALGWRESSSARSRTSSCRAPPA